MTDDGRNRRLELLVYALHGVGVAGLLALAGTAYAGGNLQQAGLMGAIAMMVAVAGRAAGRTAARR